MASLSTSLFHISYRLLIARWLAQVVGFSSGQRPVVETSSGAARHSAASVTLSMPPPPVLFLPFSFRMHSRAAGLQASSSRWCALHQAVRLV
jgi:hypothetical protein